MKERVVGYVMLVETWRAASPHSQCISFLDVHTLFYTSLLSFLSLYLFIYQLLMLLAERDAARHVSTKIPYQVREEQPGRNTTHCEGLENGL